MELGGNPPGATGFFIERHERLLCARGGGSECRDA
jgi:hypothetical protein